MFLFSYFTKSKTTYFTRDLLASHCDFVASRAAMKSLLLFSRDVSVGDVMLQRKSILHLCLVLIHAPHNQQVFNLQELFKEMENNFGLQPWLWFDSSSWNHRQNRKPLKQGWGTFLLSQAAWIVHHRWRSAKSINFILKFYFYLMRKSDLSWLTIYVPAYHGALFQRDVVL